MVGAYRLIGPGLRRNGLAAFAAVLCFLSSPVGGQEPGPTAPTPTASYRQRTLSGFRILVNPAAEEHPETRSALELLRRKLQEIARIVSADRLAKLRDVRIWVEWRSRPNGAAEFHGSRDWLREHGYNADKTGCVEINNVCNFVAWCSTDQPMMVLHELAHAYQHLVLGDNDAGMLAAYDHAVQSGLYESVDYVHGGKRRAYAQSNAKEYFAELTECYYGRNDFYPFTSQELRQYDPEGFRLMQKVWGAPARMTADQHRQAQAGRGRTR